MARLDNKGRGSAGTRRYSLVLPEDLFVEVERLADERHMTVVEVLRKFIRLGLLAMQIDQNPNAALILREDSKDTQILLI